MKHPFAGADKVFAKLEVKGETELMVMLAQGGAVNRVGGMDDDHNPFCIGTSDEGLFTAFMEQLPAELAEMSGRYTFPDPQGDLCLLSLSLSGPTLDTGFEFTYGSDSQGPPEEIVALVELLLDLTDPWYDEQRQRKKRNK
ncbi:MAG: hypothetical protein AAFQ87_24780 [Bacteroidota bacterium]